MRKICLPRAEAGSATVRLRFLTGGPGPLKRRVASSGRGVGSIDLSPNVRHYELGLNGSLTELIGEPEASATGGIHFVLPGRLRDLAADNFLPLPLTGHLPLGLRLRRAASTTH